MIHWLKNRYWIVKAIGLFRSNIIWKLLGIQSSGERLVKALNSRNENLQTLAVIFLVQGGRKTFPLLEKELEHRRNLPLILMLLGDIDEPESEAYLRRYMNDSDPKVADAAKQAMSVLLFKHGHD